MKKNKTCRGFNKIEFDDCYGEKCSIQESSLATEKAIWIGLENVKPIIMASKINENLTGWVEYPIPNDVVINTRMHLTKEQVKELLPILKKFCDTGGI